MAQSVEHVIGNDEVISSILITSSIENPRKTLWYKDLRGFLCLPKMTCFVLKIALNCANSFGLSTGWLTKWLTPDGSRFIYKDIQKDAEPTGSDIAFKKTSKGPDISSASNNSISQPAEKSTENAKNVM